MAMRMEEARQAGIAAGIEYQVLDIDDGRLEANLLNRERLIRLIREYNPDLIFTHRTNDYHPDHRNTGMLIQDSSYLLMVPNICPEVPCLRHQPVILYMFDDFKNPTPFRGDVIIDIDEVFDKKAELIHCHKSQFYEWLPWVEKEIEQVPEADIARLKWLKEKLSGWDGAVAERFRDKLTAWYGQKQGPPIKYAEAFEISEYGGALPLNRLKDFFPF